jgi:polysaccharide deacetylase 2 family uncharacterized protein YibQ
VKQRVLVVLLLVGLLLLSGFLTNVVLELVYSPGHTRAETPMFPDSKARLLHTIVEAEFLHPEVMQKSLTEHAIQQDALTWTSYAYTVHVLRQGVFSEIAYALSEAVPANGGKIFQTYFQPEDHKASISLGLDSFITHTVSITWDALPAETPLPVQERPQGKYLAAIVIDDLGSSEYAVKRLLNMDTDFTFSILPHLEKSSSIATWLHEQQKEILLHLPMEPQGYEYPGRGALLMRMTPDEIQRTIQEDLRTVPFAAGVNNHMGSRLTASKEKMQAVVQTLQQKNLFFLDSRTSGHTVAYQTAKQLGLRTAERKVFLDSLPGYDFARSQLQELAALAEQGKPAIAIGHPKDATLKALEDMLPEFEQRNIQIVRLSQFVE